MKNFKLNRVKVKTLPLRSRRRIGCPLFIIYSSGSPSHGTEKKRNEGIQIEKGIKLFLKSLEMT